MKANQFEGPIVSVVETGSRPEQGYASVGYEGRDLSILGWWTGFKNTGDIRVNPLLGNLLSITDGTGLSSVNDERNDVYNLDVQQLLNFPKTNRLTYGLNYRHIRVASNFLPEVNHQDRLGIYIQDEWKTTQMLSIVVGLRFDMHSDINPTYSPRGALIYKPFRDHTFRTSASVAYRPPSTFETAREGFGTVTLPPPFPSLPPNFLQASGNLDPEQITSYELAYQGWFFRHRLRIRTELFYNQISDLIQTRATSPTTTTTVNQGTGDIYGVDAGLEFLVSSWLEGFANGAYHHISQTFQDDNRRAGP